MSAKYDMLTTSCYLTCTFSHLSFPVYAFGIYLWKISLIVATVELHFLFLIHFLQYKRFNSKEP